MINDRELFEKSIVRGPAERAVLDHLKREGKIEIWQISSYYSSSALAVPLAQKFITYGIAVLDSPGILKYVDSKTDIKETFDLPEFPEEKK